MFDRRQVLTGATVLALSAGAGGYALTLAPPAPGAEVLSVEELAVVRACAEVWFPAGAFPVGGADPWVLREVDGIASDLLDPVRLAAFRYVLRTLEWGTFASRGTRFTALDPETRAEVLEAWATPGVMPRRIALDSLRAVLGMAYFRHPEVLATIGWRAECSAGAA